MTQFGYGRRTCQGQTVTEADLIAGIGSMAWLFDISKEPKEHKKVGNLKTSISQEELIMGLSEHSHEDEYEVPLTSIGAYPAPDPEERRQTYFRDAEKKKRTGEEKAQKEDPTLAFSTLLIAKPLPFTFSITPRCEKRAQMVRELYEEKKAQGEFVESRSYWGKESGEGKEFGWVPVGPTGKQVLGGHP
jgi:hypothetical protein